MGFDAAAYGAATGFNNFGRRIHSLGGATVAVAQSFRGKQLTPRKVSLWEMATILQGGQMFSGGYGQDIDLFIDSVSGNNSNSGSFLAPKQTMAGITSWLPGQVVALKRGGIYRTTTVTTLSAAGCALIAYGSGNPPVVLGSPAAITSGWSNVSGNVYSRTAPANIVNLFKVTTYTLVGFTKLTNNTSTPTTPAAGEWGSSGGNIYTYSTVDPNTLTFEYGITSRGLGSMITMDAQYCLTQDVSTFCWDGTGIMIGNGTVSDHCVVRGCESAFNTTDGIDGYSGNSNNPKDFLVEWCRAWSNGNNPVKDGSGADGDGFSFHGSAAGTDYAQGVIRYNDARYNRKSGIGNQSHVLCDVYGNRSENNYDCYAIYSTVYTGGVAMKHRFWSNIGVRTTGDAHGYGFANNQRHALTVELYGNTSYSTGTDFPSAIGYAAGIALPNGSQTPGNLSVKMRNNIFKGFYRGIQKVGTLASFDSDYNCVQGNSTNFFDNVTNTAASLGEGAHTITTDPTFKSASLDGDFRLSSGSPAIGTGIDVSGLLAVSDLVDFKRKPVPTLVSMGALQSV